jgi:hypothetical protein
MKISLILFFILFAAKTCLGQVFTLNQGEVKTKNYYAELPYESVNGKLIINVLISGKFRRFLFDTGAPVALSKSLSEEIKAVLLNRDLLKDVNGNIDSVSYIKINEINVGGVVFKNIPAVGAMPEIYKCWNVEGVIGSNLLRNTVISINSGKHLIIFTDQPDKLSLDQAKSIPLFTNSDGNRQSKPVINLKLGNKVIVQLDFDTGDNDFLRCTDRLMAWLRPYEVYKIVGKGYGATSIGGYGLQAEADKYLLNFSFLTLGNARFEHFISETQRDGTSAIGTGILNYGDVTLDFINHRFYFKARQKRFDLNKKQWPFQPTIKDDKLVIGLVWEKGMNLVKPGEQIISVDGKDYTHVDFCELLNAPPILSGKDSAILTIRDDQGQKRNVKIVKNRRP